MKTDMISEILEPLVDQHGLLHVLAGLSLLCSEKAAHLRVNWQDAKSAKLWDADAKTIENASRKINN